MKQNRETIIDIGSGKIAALAGVSTPDGSFVVDANSSVPCDVYYRGELIKNDIAGAVAASLDEVQRSLRKKIKEVYVGVPADFCVVATNQTSTSWRKGSVISREDIDYLSRRANSFSEAKGTHFLIDSAPLSFFADDKMYCRGIEGIFANSLTAEFSYVFVSKYFTDFFEKVIKSMDAEVKGYIPVPAAQSLFLLDEASRDGTSILVDCGFTVTSVAFIRGNGLLYLDSFPLGSAHLSYNLMEALGVREYETVESLKSVMNLNLEVAESDNYILRGSSFKARRVNEVVTDFIKQIARCIDACGRECPYVIPKGVKLFITGGGLNYIKGGIKILSDRFGKEFQTIRSPDIKMRHPEYSSTYAVLKRALALNKQNVY